MGGAHAPAGAAHAHPAFPRDPTAPRQPRTRLQGPGMLEGIHPIAEPPARSGAGPAPLPEPISDLRAEHGPRPSPKSALDPRERRARLSHRMDAGRSRRLRGWPARSVPRGPQRRGVLVSRVKQVAGSGVRESWGRRGRRSRGGPRWGGSRRSPRGSDGVVVDAVVLGVGCQVQGVWDLFEEHPARTSGTRSRVRVTRSAPGCGPGCGRGAARGGW
jgi:hypothetical protein